MLLLSLAPLLTMPPTAAATPRAVTFAFWGDPEEQLAYLQMIDEFEAVNPDIDIVPIYTAAQSDYLRKVATSFAGGNAPDLFLMNYRGFGQYASADVLQPVAPYLAASESIAASDYYEMALDAFAFGDSGQTCMPQNISSLVVYYNRDLFLANGVPLPTDDWTWDDFTEAAVALTLDMDGDGETDVYGLGVEQSLYRMAPFIWGSGGELVDNPASPTTFTLDSPAAKKALTWFAHLGASGLNVAPSEVEAQAEDDEARFMRGGMGMFLQSRRVVPTLRTIDRFTWDVAPLPTGSQRATVLHSDGLCMAATASEKADAWAFIEFVAGDPGQTILTKIGRVVPSRKQIAESALFLRPRVDEVALAPANNEVYLDNIAYMHQLPNISNWLEIEDAFNARFGRIFYDSIDIATASRDVTAETRPIFARAAG